MVTHLNPVIVLIEDDDADTLRPLVARLADNFQHVPDDTRRLMNTNGWTPEMLAWSLVFRGIAAGVRDGTIDVEITPSPADIPNTHEPAD